MLINIVTKTRKDRTTASTMKTDVESDDSGGFEVDNGSQAVDKNIIQILNLVVWHKSKSHFTYMKILVTCIEETKLIINL